MFVRFAVASCPQTSGQQSVTHARPHNGVPRFPCPEAILCHASFVPKQSLPQTSYARTNVFIYQLGCHTSITCFPNTMNVFIYRLEYRLEYHTNIMFSLHCSGECCKTRTQKGLALISDLLTSAEFTVFMPHSCILTVGSCNHPVRLAA